MSSFNRTPSLFTASPVRIVDVTARDGLQNEKDIVPTDTSIVDRKVGCVYHKDIEVTS